MANALKLINARTKKLAKMPKNKNKKYGTLRKQASSEYNKGKLGRRSPAKKKKVVHRKKRRVARKSHPKKRAVRRRVHHPKKRAVRRHVHHAKPKVIRRRTVVVYKTKRTKRRSVSGFDKTIKKLAVPVLLAVGAYLVLKPKTPIPPIQQTSNPVRNQTANNILLYAQAASMTAAEIAKLINTINQASDTQVQQIYSNVTAGSNPYENTPFIAGIGRKVAAMQ